MGKPVVLCILDGWGHREGGKDNAIAQADTPTWDTCWNTYPHTLLKASGEAVGLPSTQMGNSEVGHLHLGAGRLVEQDLPRIHKHLSDVCANREQLFARLCTQLAAASNTLHIMGLFSPGGVHSHEDHVRVLLESAKQHGLKRVVLHLFLDGRDVPPRSAHASLKTLQTWISDIGIGEVGSIIGRYYAMDRDHRWERVQQAYELLTQGKAEYEANSAEQGLNWAYAHNKSDEFVPPISVLNANGQPSCIHAGDGICFFNFRADRARELTRAFIDPSFSAFKRSQVPLAGFLSMTEYAHDLPTDILFPQQQLKEGLADVLAQHHLKQLRLAETEKYAHVTFFFNGGQEAPVSGESRQLIPSPKVATYDLQPEMSAVALTDALVSAIESQAFDVIICNYANPDMVGHTGNFKASVQAVETIDACLDRMLQALQAVGGEALITADHGNIEHLFDSSTGQAHTAHTTELVPLVYLGNRYTLSSSVGTLADVAPSLLHLLSITPPDAMTGNNLFLSKKT